MNGAMRIITITMEMEMEMEKEMEMGDDGLPDSMVVGIGNQDDISLCRISNTSNFAKLGLFYIPKIDKIYI